MISASRGEKHERSCDRIDEIAAVTAAGVLLLVLTFLPSEVLWLRFVKAFLIVVCAIEITLYCLRAVHTLIKKSE